MSEQHTKEPWQFSETRVYLNNEGGFDLRNAPSPEANARRIVACVNACAGIGTHALELIASVGGVEHKMTATAALARQNDRLLEALKLCAVLVRGGNRQGDSAIAKAKAIIAEVEAGK